MQLTLSPLMSLPGQPETTLHVAGDVLTIDGIPHDLGAIPEGGEGVWEDSPIIGPIRRIGGILHARVLVRLGETAMHDQPADPGHWVVVAAEGAVRIPALRKTGQEV